jgi:hypothetical protein
MAGYGTNWPETGLDNKVSSCYSEADMTDNPGSTPGFHDSFSSMKNVFAGMFRG